MKATTLRNLTIAMALLLGTTAATCDTGEDSHPSAPQVPGPDRGGPPVPTPGQPNPQPGDPPPLADEMHKRVMQDPHIAIMYVIWLGERRYFIDYSVGGANQRIEQRAQHSSGGWWKIEVAVTPGQRIGFTAGPTDTRRQFTGNAQCFIFHISGRNQFIADFQTVPAGPCAVSYVIPA